MRAHLAVYGNTTIVRKRCPECGDEAFVLDGAMACCGAAPPDDSAKKAIQIVPPEQRRRTPPEYIKREILEAQGGCCFYCGRLFGSLVVRDGKFQALRIHWDHQVPYSYSLDNQTDNFVAACHVCNLLKGNKVFETTAAATDYLMRRWDKKGYMDANEDTWGAERLGGLS